MVAVVPETEQFPVLVSEFAAAGDEAVEHRAAVVVPMLEQERFDGFDGLRLGVELGVYAPSRVLTQRSLEWWRECEFHQVGLELGGTLQSPPLVIR